MTSSSCYVSVFSSFEYRYTPLLNWQGLNDDVIMSYVCNFILRFAPCRPTSFYQIGKVPNDDVILMSCICNFIMQFPLVAVLAEFSQLSDISASVVLLVCSLLECTSMTSLGHRKRPLWKCNRPSQTWRNLPWMSRHIRHCTWYQRAPERPTSEQLNRKK